MPAPLVDAMRAAGPAARHYDPESKPVMELLRRVLKMRNIAELSVVKNDFRLELRGAGSGALSA
jgi:oxaloacetate decarboxylase alpha subunit